MAAVSHDRDSAWQQPTGCTPSCDARAAARGRYHHERYIRIEDLLAIPDVAYRRHGRGRKSGSNAALRRPDRSHQREVRMSRLLSPIMFLPLLLSSPACMLDDAETTNLTDQEVTVPPRGEPGVLDVGEWNLEFFGSTTH